MRKEEQVDLIIEQIHPDGTTSQVERTYKIKVSYDAWIQATRTNMLGRNQNIVQIKKGGDIIWRRYQEPQPTPRSTPLF